MPFFGHKYYGSHNDLWSTQTQAGDGDRARRDGWCAAASAIWCSNMLLKGTPPEKSKPNQTYAGVLQVKYRWDPSSNGQDVLHLLANVNLTGQVAFSGDRGQMVGHMQAHPGVYWFRAHGHAMAADTRPRRKLWYDIENGLYGYDHVWTMKCDLALGYHKADGWQAILCAIG
jgi:hypothetical protein